eukprot:TRINITY_DN9098_c0_g1_i1.p1 TRINITY_DN9098_c0_g1~~TRINITY_DN9098_c0_g1_i1.p1  ORF type:complete len:486 (+),score=64.54 TRINITY_DN9098_c0_g1_i1:28-1485(+)
MFTDRCKSTTLLLVVALVVCNASPDTQSDVVSAARTQPPVLLHSEAVETSDQKWHNITSYANGTPFDPLDIGAIVAKPFSVRHHVWASFLTFATVVMCSLGGVAGGGLLVPLYMFSIHASIVQAIPLSKAAIFGGAAANLFFNLKKKHPSSDRPLIAFNVALALEPAALAGSVLGVMLNDRLQDAFIITSKVIFGAFLAYRTFCYAHHLIANHQHEVSSPAIDCVADCGAIPSAELEDLLKEESTLTFPKLALMVGLWAIVSLFSLVKGDRASPSPLATALGATHEEWIRSFLHLSLSITFFFLLFVATTAFCRHCHLVHLRKVRLRYRFAEGDPMWCQRNVVAYPLWALVAGTAAGLLGTGGGMVYCPLLLYMGLLPSVAASTASFMILFTSSSMAFQFFVLGQLQARAAVWYAFMGSLGAICGQHTQRIVLNRMRMVPSATVTVFALALVIALSSLVSAVAGVVTAGNVSQHARHLKWLSKYD